MIKVTTYQLPFTSYKSPLSNFEKKRVKYIESNQSEMIFQFISTSRPARFFERTW